MFFFWTQGFAHENPFVCVTACEMLRKVGFRGLRESGCIKISRTKSFAERAARHSKFQIENKKRTGAKMSRLRPSICKFSLLFSIPHSFIGVSDV